MLYSNNSNTSQFSEKVTLIPDALNSSGKNSYSYQDKEALAQLVMTASLKGSEFESKILELSKKVDPEFLAKLAIFSRQNGFMKDTSAFLSAILVGRDSSLLKKIFSRTISDPKMLRKFVEFMRSGKTGRKSLGSVSKKLVQNYLNNLTEDQLFKADIGNKPSLSDILKLSHPRPSTPARAAMYSYILGKEVDKNNLFPLALEFENFKKELGEKVPNVPFQMLTALKLTNEHWKQIAVNSTWTQMRMNLNTFARHGVFEDKEVCKKIAEKLASKEEVLRSKVFPYQIYSAYMNIDSSIPIEIKKALEIAVKFSLENVPEFDGKVYVLVDVSGSMSSGVLTGGKVSSSMTCLDIAALFASAVLAKNPTAGIIPFDTRVHSNTLTANNSIMQNADILKRYGGGGTNCSLALKSLNSINATGDIVIFISDNEANIDPNHYSKTAIMHEWNEFKKNNPDSKIVNIDIVPRTTTQLHSRNDILNVGGFSDQIFQTINDFSKNKNKALFLQEIENIKI